MIGNGALYPYLIDLGIGPGLGEIFHPLSLFEHVNSNEIIMHVYYIFYILLITS